MGLDITWILESPAWFSVLQDYAVVNGWKEYNQTETMETITLTYQKGNALLVFFKYKVKNALYRVTVNNPTIFNFEYEPSTNKYKAMFVANQIVPFQEFFDLIKYQITVP